MLELLSMISLGLAWLVPNHYPPWSSFYNESAAALAILLLVLSQGRRFWGHPQSATMWAVLAAASVPWLHWLWGSLAFSGDALVSSLYLVGLACAIAVGTAWARAEPRASMEMLSGTVVAAALVSTALGLVQVLQVGSLGIWSLDAYAAMRAYANLGQPNNLATLLGLGVLGAIHLYERGRIGTVATAAVAGFLILGAALTQSRTALLFGPAIFLGITVTTMRGLRRRTGLVAVAAFTAVHVALTWLWPAIQQLLLLATPASLVERSVGGSLRLQVWQLLLDAMSRQPWTGYGWLQVGAAQMRVAELHPVDGHLWMHAHNLFVDLIVWCGYPLGLLLSLSILYWYISRLSKARTMESAVALLAVTLVGIHAMLELPHHYAYFLLPVGLWVGQVEAEVGTRSRRPSRWVAAPVLLGLLMTAALWRDYAEVEEDFRLVRFETMGIGSLRAAQPAPDAPFLSGLTAFLRFSRTEPSPGMSDEALRAMELVVTRYPYAPAMYRWARALALNGRDADGRLVLTKLHHMHGDRYAERVRWDIEQRIANGETGLRPLLRAVPKWERDPAVQP